MSTRTAVAGKMADDDDDKRLLASEVHKRQRSKNFAMLAVLVGLVVLFYVVALVRMSGG